MVLKNKVEDASHMQAYDTPLKKNGHFEEKKKLEECLGIRRKIDLHK